MAENSAAAAIAATGNLLAEINPHMDDAMGLTALGVLLPVASSSLQTIGKFEAEVPGVLQKYIATCDKPTKPFKLRTLVDRKTGKPLLLRGNPE
jgi:hypothetical protein